MLTPRQLESILERFHDLEKKMSDSPDAQAYIALSRDYAELSPLVAQIKEKKKYEDELQSLETLLTDPDTDPELHEMAQEEKQALEGALETLLDHIQRSLLPKDTADSRNAIMEIRAGTGGEEAALFAGDLFRMYEAYCPLYKWKIEVLSVSESDVGGYKEIIAIIRGQDVFARLKFESGTHRVQRIPTTESGGRIHTSAATVAVLPEAEDVDIALEDKDLRIDVFRASGAGGQHVNTTDSAVRITHIPTGIVVSVQDERSQHKNKAKAFKLLRARLFELERRRLEEERAENRKAQVGSGDRSERIRTYNFPQGRVTDHRINLTLYKLSQILSGESLDDLIQPLILDHETRLLADMTERADPKVQ